MFPTMLNGITFNKAPIPEPSHLSSARCSGHAACGAFVGQRTTRSCTAAFEIAANALIRAIRGAGGI